MLLHGVKWTLQISSLPMLCAATSAAPPVAKETGQTRVLKRGNEGGGTVDRYVGGGVILSQFYSLLLCSSVSKVCMRAYKLIYFSHTEVIQLSGIKNCISLLEIVLVIVACISCRPPFRLRV